tara:strand:+ start:2384 stop:2986 length:603 start_codon:yes stop_codon:yes gene_type:complete
MKAPFDFVIEPKGNRYNNTKQVAGKNLILNTEVYNHEFVNREAIVKSVPTAYKTKIKPGDTIVTHHNVFRRWHDVKGKERNSRSYFDESTYLIKEDQIFLYKKNNKWIATDGYCFVQPIKQRDKLKSELEEDYIGIVKYTDGVYSKNELVGFTPFSTYEFIIDGKRLYRVMNKFITIKYEHQGNEEEYNPSWAESCRRVD